MAGHENTIGESDEWFTPREIFDALGLRFDLDPCSPGAGHWVPANHVYTKQHDGLACMWFGLVFCNPPYGARHGHVPWLQKFLDHGNGVAIFRSYTSAGWFHDYMPRAHGLLFPRGKTKFVRPDGTIGAQPGHGIVLVGMGDAACTALAHSKLGMWWNRR